MTIEETKLVRKCFTHIWCVGRVVRMEKELKIDEYQTVNPVVVAPGWQVQAGLTKNSSGDLVITKLIIEATDSTSMAEGINANILRAIRIRDLVESAEPDIDDTDFWLYSTHPDYEPIRKQWLKEVSGEWPRVGPNKLSKTPYAKVAFFYVNEVRESPMSPMQSLAEKLDVDKSTVARRVDTARKLGLLHRPISENGPSGKAGGFLTKEAHEILFSDRSESE